MVLAPQAVNPCGSQEESLAHSCGLEEPRQGLRRGQCCSNDSEAFFPQEKNHQHSLNATHRADTIPFLRSHAMPR